MKRIRVTIEIDIRDDKREIINENAKKLFDNFSVIGKVVYIATEVVVTSEKVRKILHDET